MDQPELLCENAAQLSLLMLPPWEYLSLLPCRLLIHVLLLLPPDCRSVMPQVEPLCPFHPPGLSEPSGKCAAGFYCTGGAASSKPMDGATGNICPLGAYCSEYLECPEPGMLGLLISDFATKY